MPYLRQRSATLAPASSLRTEMICSSVYLLGFSRALLMPYHHRGTLRATGLVFGGKVSCRLPTQERIGFVVNNVPSAGRVARAMARDCDYTPARI